MSDLSKDDLKSYLEKKNYDFVTKVKDTKQDGIDFFLFVEADSISEKSELPNITSYYHMMRIKTQIEESFNLKVEWIVKKGTRSSYLVKVIQDLINKKYPNSVESVALSPINFKPLWIYVEKRGDSKKDINPDNILSDLKPFFDLYDIDEVKITIQNAYERFPANPAILLCIKIHAPIKLHKISQELIEKGYDGATSQWLKPKIETLRKYGLIVWSKNDIYSLSLNAQHTFSYVNPKNSPDVLRALELGKRIWDN